MFILRSNQFKPGQVDPEIETAANSIEQDWLRQTVERISIPRHYEAQPENNREIAGWIEYQFQNWGYQTFRQGEFDNIVAIPKDVPLENFQPNKLVGAHYDSKPNTPGADDNGSAVAAMLGCARTLSELAGDKPKHNCAFVAFNREEDGLLGAYDFVDNFLCSSEPSNRPNQTTKPNKPAWPLNEVHILEMVGYCQHTAGSQDLPPGLPIKLGHDKGDFLAVIANRHSNSRLKPIIQCAATYVPDFPVWGLKVIFGLEKKFSDLRRSDHAPFWDQKIPAFMWTDTSEFRNPNYHLPSDTPDTLDYEFLQLVTRLLVAKVLS